MGMQEVHAHKERHCQTSNHHLHAPLRLRAPPPPPPSSLPQPRTGRHLSASTTVNGNVNANNNKANNAGSAYGLSPAFFSKEGLGARGSGFRGGVLAVATEDGAGRGMERGEGVRGLEAAVRFFPRCMILLTFLTLCFLASLLSRLFVLA